MVTKYLNLRRHNYSVRPIRQHHVVYSHNFSKKRRKGCWTVGTEWNVTRGNGQKEEETVMSRNDSFLSDILIHPLSPHTNRRKGGMGVQEDWRDRGESGGEGLKRTWVKIREIKTMVWKDLNRMEKWRRKERYWVKISDLGQFRTLTALISLSSNYFNIILSSSWKSRRRFLLCCPMMSFTSLQATKSSSTRHPNPPPPDHSRPLLKHSWTQARFQIYWDMRFKYKIHSHSFSVVMVANVN